MGRVTDSREILIAEALGDFKVLFDRVDAVLPKLESTIDRMELSTSAFVRGLEPLRQHASRVVVAERDQALRRIAVGAHAMSSQAHQQQLDAIPTAVRDAVRAGIADYLGRREDPLRRPKRPPISGPGWWLGHLVTAVLSASGTLLVLWLSGALPSAG